MKGPPQERRIPLEFSWKSLFRRGLPREIHLRRRLLEGVPLGGVPLKRDSLGEGRQEITAKRAGSTLHFLQRFGLSLRAKKA